MYSGLIEKIFKNLKSLGCNIHNCFVCQEPVDCEPPDGYDEVLVCDNNAGQTSTRCSYSQTIGTQFSDSVSEGMSVDTTVEAEIAAMFWGLFR